MRGLMYQTRGCDTEWKQLEVYSNERVNVSDYIAVTLDENNSGLTAITGVMYQAKCCETGWKQFEAYSNERVSVSDYRF